MQSTLNSTMGQNPDLSCILVLAGAANAYLKAEWGPFEYTGAGWMWSPVSPT